MMRARVRGTIASKIAEARVVLAVVAAMVAAVAVLGACGGDDGDDGDTVATDPVEQPAETTATTTTTAAPTPALRVLVTNDDGVGAAGIDALVEALRTLPDTEVTVIAPAENQSGSGGKTTDGPLTVNDATTASGYEAKAVAGFPADTVIWALDQGGLGELGVERPHVVVSGINEGQNLGVVVDISGTVGAARAAAARGIPALAVSQGLTEGVEPDYPAGVDAVLAWLETERAGLAGRDVTSTAPAEVTNLNIPTCATGEVRDTVVVPLAGNDENPFAPQDCASSLAVPATDVQGFLNGFVVRTDDLALEPVG